MKLYDIHIHKNIKLFMTCGSPDSYKRTLNYKERCHSPLL